MRLGDAIFVGLNGLRNRLSSRTYPAERVLLLLPHCLQNSDCDVRLKGDLFRCRGCGRCKMSKIKELAQQLGVRTFVATGGRDAARRARENDIGLIVAVACRRELAEGIRAVFPRRVVGIYNSWPHGECVDTDVDVEALETLLKRCIRKNEDPTGEQA